MSQQNETGVISVTAAAARSAFLRVYNSSGTWTTAGASVLSDGVQQIPSVATTDIVPVRLATAPGTRKMMASGVIAIGATAYAGASGKIAGSGTIVEGRALEAAAADGDIIEVIPLHENDVSTAITGTTAATFEVDSDSAIPKIALASYVGGTGDFTTTIKPEAALAGDTTVTIPEATDDTIALLALAQTLSNKTIAAPIVTGHITNSYTTTPVAAAGTTVADAGQLPATDYCHITSDGATKGVKLPTGVKGMVITIINNSATACELYAASGGTVNGAAADASVVITASLPVVCMCTAADTWIVYDLGAVAAAS